LAAYVAESVLLRTLKPFNANDGHSPLPVLLTKKYQSMNANAILGDLANISRLFIELQQH
jgi:hypothetical protein